MLFRLTAITPNPHLYARSVCVLKRGEGKKLLPTVAFLPWEWRIDHIEIQHTGSFFFPYICHRETHAPPHAHTLDGGSVLPKLAGLAEVHLMCTATFSLLHKTNVLCLIYIGKLGTLKCQGSDLQPPAIMHMIPQCPLVAMPLPVHVTEFVLVINIQ